MSQGNARQAMSILPPVREADQDHQGEADHGAARSYIQPNTRDNHGQSKSTNISSLAYGLSKMTTGYSKYSC